MPPALFDILPKHEDGSLVWWEAARDIHTAKSRLEHLGASSPGKFLIFDDKKQGLVAVIATKTPQLLLQFHTSSIRRIAWQISQKGNMSSMSCSICGTVSIICSIGF